MEDQRIRLSKSMLKNALLTLLARKSLDKISVSELCQTANINRTTFYKYYGSPYDLLWETADDFFDHLALHLKDADGEADSLEGALEYLDQQRDVFRILAATIPDQEFTQRLFRIPATIDYVAGRTWPEPESHYAETFLYHGGYAVIRDWMENEQRESAADMARILKSLWEKLY